MEILSIWKEPLASANGGTNVKFAFESNKASLLLYFGDKVFVTMTFEHVVSFKHNNNSLFKSDVRYSGLYLIKDSDREKEINTLLIEHMPWIIGRHFIYDNHNDGRFEIMAESCRVVEHFSLKNKNNN